MIEISPTALMCVNVTVAPLIYGRECVDGYVIMYNSSFHAHKMNIKGESSVEFCHPSLCQALTTFTACAVEAGVEPGNCSSSVSHFNSTGLFLINLFQHSHVYNSFRSQSSSAYHCNIFNNYESHFNLGNAMLAGIPLFVTLVAMTQIDDLFNKNETIMQVAWGLDEEEVNKAQDLLPVTQNQTFTFSVRYSDIHGSNLQLFYVLRTQLHNCIDTTHFFSSCKFN